MNIILSIYNLQQLYCSKAETLKEILDSKLVKSKRKADINDVFCASDG